MTFREWSDWLLQYKSHPERVFCGIALMWPAWFPFDDVPVPLIAHGRATRPAGPPALEYFHDPGAPPDPTKVHEVDFGARQPSEGYRSSPFVITYEDAFRGMQGDAYLSFAVHRYYGFPDEASVHLVFFQWSSQGPGDRVADLWLSSPQPAGETSVGKYHFPIFSAPGPVPEEWFHPISYTDSVEAIPPFLAAPIWLFFLGAT